MFFLKQTLEKIDEMMSNHLINKDISYQNTCMGIIFQNEAKPDLLISVHLKSDDWYNPDSRNKDKNLDFIIRPYNPVGDVIRYSEGVTLKPFGARMSFQYKEEDEIEEFANRVSKDIYGRVELFFNELSNPVDMDIPRRF